MEEMITKSHIQKELDEFWLEKKMPVLNSEGH